jgi:hypothetical protein
MQILQHSAPFSYSLLPSVPLLTAPIPSLQLTAPRIAGLLPSSTLRKVEVMIDKPLTFAELLRQLGPIRTLAEIDAEINAVIETRFAVRQAIRQAVQ